MEESKHPRAEKIMSKPLYNSFNAELSSFP